MSRIILEPEPVLRPEPDARSRSILEYDKIIAELARHARSAPGRDLCLALLPATDID